MSGLGALDRGDASDILVLAGAGTGHYHPVAGLLSSLDPSWRVTVSARVAEDHPMRRKVLDDGFDFVPWPTPDDHRRSEALLRAARRRVNTILVARLAAGGAADAPLPPVSARAAFGAASLIAPLSTARQGATIDDLLRRVRPRLVMCEVGEDWIGGLAERHGIDWIYYTTGPVSTVTRGRPVGPAGFDPHARGVERAANTALLVAKQLRRRAQLRAVRRSGLVASDPRRWRDPVAKVSLSVPELDADPQLPPHDIDYGGFFPYRAPDGWDHEVAGATSGHRDTVLVTWGSGTEPDDERVLGALAPTLERLSSTMRVVVIGAQRRSGPGVALHPRIVTMDRADGPPYEELRRARLTISHGGYGTIKEAVALGSPVLTIPALAADRMETAQRILSAGVGGVLDRTKIAAAPAEEVIRRLLDDDGVAASVDRVGRALRDPRRRETTVSLVESHLAAPS